MNKSALGACIVLAGLAGHAEERTVWMDTLDLAVIQQGWGEAKANLSVGGKQPLCLNGHTYAHGVGSHAAGVIHVALDGRAKRFQTIAGIDDCTNGQGTAVIRVFSEDAVLLESDVLRGKAAPLVIDLDITGLRRLALVMGDAEDGIDFDNVDWADARFIVEGEAPRLVTAPEEPKVKRTPAPPKTPRINGPLVYGVRPGHPFLYRIPATGERPMTFGARALPEGLALDTDTGIITGTITSPMHRAYETTLKAQNAQGIAERPFRIVVGDTLALTPPMGWNSWYAHYDRITDAMMREAADILLSSGMADVGYQYVNIDDCWPNRKEHGDPMRVGPFRDSNGNVLPNQHFPDMKALTDYIHAKGLKAGIYTSPGPTTCGSYAGAWEHEEQDARQFAAWGFDFLKYDWCSYNEIAADKSLPEMKKPYVLMGNILKELDRDIVLNLCQYGMGDVWEWGQEVGGQCWRTSGDLGFELARYPAVARSNGEHYRFAGPGAWNDPDYLLIGYVGSAKEMGEPVPCALTANEQYSYMSLWCLMAAPLVYSGDMTRLDEFTLNVLCNPEVIAIDQDPLGKQGHCVVGREGAEIWMKELQDGAVAVGLFNLSELPRDIAVDWSEIDREGAQDVRDLWTHQDLGVFDNRIARQLGRHDVALLRLAPVRK